MQVRLLDHQFDAIDTYHKFTLLSGGIGSGKTHTGAGWILSKCDTSPDSLGLITANTYGQLQKATLAAVFRLFSDWGIPYNYNKNTSILTVGDQKEFLCLGLDSYDNHRGIEVGEWWGDEVAYNKREAFEVMAGRLRDRRGKLDVLFTTTLKGYNWVYEYFHPNGEKHDPNIYRWVRAKSTDNPFLPDGYIDTLKQQYDDKLIKQELEGEFVNVQAGNIYYAFDRDKNIQDVKIDWEFPIWIGCDFNVNPMTAVVGQVINNQLRIVDEFYLKHSNTEALSSEIIARYGRNVTVVPDSTGRKSTTNASISDIQILKKYFTVKVANNPFRIDRYAAVNGAFARGRVVISPNCQYTIKDLESVVYKEGTNKPDDSDKMLTHISDALGYLIYRTINPLKGQGKVKQIKR